jgi:membrane protein implicated in regulation of membrane protease activity
MSNVELLIGDNIALFWVMIGVLALIVEVLLPGGFLLSFSVAGFLVAAAYFFTEFPATFIGRFTAFAVLGVLLILPVRRLLEATRPPAKDINDY